MSPHRINCTQRPARLKWMPQTSTRHFSSSLATSLPSRLKKSSSSGDNSSARARLPDSARAMRHQLVPTRSSYANVTPRTSRRRASGVRSINEENCTVVLHTACKSYSLVSTQTLDLARIARAGCDRQKLNGELTLRRDGDNSRVVCGFLQAATQTVARARTQGKSRFHGIIATPIFQMTMSRPASFPPRLGIPQRPPRASSTHTNRRNRRCPMMRTDAAASWQQFCNCSGRWQLLGKFER